MEEKVKVLQQSTSTPKLFAESPEKLWSQIPTEIKNGSLVYPLQRRGDVYVGGSRERDEGDDPKVYQISVLEYVASNRTYLFDNMHI
jgi:hypothetical protein